MIPKARGPWGPVSPLGMGEKGWAKGSKERYGCINSGRVEQQNEAGDWSEAHTQSRLRLRYLNGGFPHEARRPSAPVRPCLEGLRTETPPVNRALCVLCPSVHERWMVSGASQSSSDSLRSKQVCRQSVTRVLTHRQPLTRSDCPPFAWRAREPPPQRPCRGS